MAYGDGGFFFTQPVGNGYSGLGALGSTAPFSIAPAIHAGASPVRSIRRVVPSDEPPTFGPSGSLSPMPMLTAEEAQTIGLMSPEGSDDFIETTSAEGTGGVMDYFRQNMLVSAAIIGAIGFFGYRYAKKQGMIA